MSHVDARHRHSHILMWVRRRKHVISCFRLQFNVGVPHQVTKRDPVPMTDLVYHHIARWHHLPRAKPCPHPPSPL